MYILEGGYFGSVIEGYTGDEGLDNSNSNGNTDQVVKYPLGSVCKVNGKAVNEKTQNLNEGEKFPNKKDINSECGKLSIEKCGDSESRFTVTDYEDDLNSASYCKVTLGDKISDKSTDKSVSGISDMLENNINGNQFSNIFVGSDFGNKIDELIVEINVSGSLTLETTNNNNIYTYLLKIGKNPNLLNRLESIIKRFIDDDDVSIKDGDFQRTFYVFIAELLSKKIDNDDDVASINQLKSRLLKYLPQILYKTVNTDDSLGTHGEVKSALIKSSYNQLFKYNTTNVSLNIFSGFTHMIDYLKTLHTVEMVIVIISVAFVLSKIFDMFRVKVEV